MSDPIFTRPIITIKLVFCILLFLFIASCEQHHPGTKQFAIDFTNKIKAEICPAGYTPAQPCGNKDARFDADWGTSAYINIYGVTNESEIKMLLNEAQTFRNGRDKSIPVYLTFYSDLEKTNQIKKIKLEGN